jgi:hypothetical protein
MFAAHYLFRKLTRYRIRNLVRWPECEDLEPGCTAIIGMCSSMPNVLVGNLTCLSSHAWFDLREIIVVVDTTRDRVDPSLEATAVAACPGIPLRFAYYESHQARMANSLMLPYVFSWLSWSIALGLCKTKTALFQDYDALIMSDRLADRYFEFIDSGVKVQGISWYNGNGVVPEDRLATTFEAFVDVSWLREFSPVRMFNDLGVTGDRSIDYDTLLELQHHELTEKDRAVLPMDKMDLVHPSQMVHQYTMFRRRPGGNLPCFSIPMIPFFEFLHIGEDPIHEVTLQIRERKSKTIPFLIDGLIVNFQQLTCAQVDWCLKQMIQACVLRGISPSPVLYEYGQALYELVETPAERVWVGDFTEAQRRWIDGASTLQGVEATVPPSR